MRRQRGAVVPKTLHSQGMSESDPGTILRIPAAQTGLAPQGTAQQPQTLQENGQIHVRDTQVSSDCVDCQARSMPRISETTAAARAWDIYSYPKDTIQQGSGGGAGGAAAAAVGDARQVPLISLFDGSGLARPAVTESMLTAGCHDRLHTSVFAEINDTLVDSVYGDCGRSMHEDGGGDKRIAGDVWGRFGDDQPIIQLVGALPKDSFLLIVTGAPCQQPTRASRHSGKQGASGRTRRCSLPSRLLLPLFWPSDLNYMCTVTGNAGSTRL